MDPADEVREHHEGTDLRAVNVVYLPQLILSLLTLPVIYVETLLRRSFHILHTLERVHEEWVQVRVVVDDSLLALEDSVDLVVDLLVLDLRERGDESLACFDEG